MRKKAEAALIELVDNLHLDIAQTAYGRYKSGVELPVRVRGVAVLDKDGKPLVFREYDTQEGDLSLKAMAGLAKRKGLNMPDKTAFTTPDGSAEASVFGAMTAAQLLAKRAEVEAQRAEKLSAESE